MLNELLVLKEVSGKSACDTFGGRGVHDRVVYYEGKNTRWFLFGEVIPIGHASMTKVGSGDEERESCHYRFGKWFIAPEYRGTPMGARYAGCLIYHFLKTVMSTSSSKIITLRAWNELLPRYYENGWINTQKSFKGSFQELRKVFYFSWTGELIEQQGFSGKLCEGIIYKGDYLTPTLFDPFNV